MDNISKLINKIISRIGIISYCFNFIDHIIYIIYVYDIIVHAKRTGCGDSASQPTLAT